MIKFQSYSHDIPDRSFIYTPPTNQEVQNREMNFLQLFFNDLKFFVSFFDNLKIVLYDFFIDFINGLIA